jgi:hypothetical protein
LWLCGSSPDGQGCGGDSGAGVSEGSLAFNDIRGREDARVLLKSVDALPVAIPKLAVGAYTVCLELTPGVGFTAWRECADGVIANAPASMLVRRGKARRKGARFGVEVRAAAPAAGQRVTVTWSSARCRTCSAHRLARTSIRLRTRLTVHSPAVARGRELRMSIKLPALRVDSGRYTAAHAAFVAGRRPK